MGSFSIAAIIVPGGATVTVTDMETGTDTETDMETDYSEPDYSETDIIVAIATVIVTGGIEVRII